MHRSNVKNTIFEYWRQFKTLEKPRYLQEQRGHDRRREKVVFELGLIFIKSRKTKNKDPYMIKDSIGRLIPSKIDDKKLYIRELIPYWKEELIYDFQKKKRVRYKEVFDEIMKINGIGQIFTLNNKIFVQNENDIWLYGNKNINDAKRLFEIIREDLGANKKGNFIFIKDTTTAQRKHLYDLLVEKGFKRTELVRHYSY